jgi:hypothetical protein
MTLLMICMGTWMQIATPTGGGHGEHVEHQAGEASHKAEPAVPSGHETQAH